MKENGLFSFRNEDDLKTDCMMFQLGWCGTGLINAPDVNIASVSTEHVGTKTCQDHSHKLSDTYVGLQMTTIVNKLGRLL